MDHDSSDLRTDVAVSPSAVAAATPLIFLADGFFSEAVEFFIGLAQVGLVRDAEDDDRIAAILAVEGSPSSCLQKSISLFKIQLHCECYLQKLVARRLSGTREYLVAEGAVQPGVENHVRAFQLLLVQKALKVIGERQAADVVLAGECRWVWGVKQFVEQFFC